MSEWQPIETAPKDGTRIDLWSRDRITNAFWRDGDWIQRIYFVRDRHQVSGEFSGAWRSRIINDPTHWMPLPEPPVTP